MKRNIFFGPAMAAALLFTGFAARSQNYHTYSLQELMDSALANNRLLSAKSWQVREKKGKLQEDGIKRYPSVEVDAIYQYNVNLPEFTIPAGGIGVVTTGSGGSQLLPDQSRNITLGDKNMYSAGINLYQPLTQQWKIRTGLEADRTDIEIAGKEKVKAELQIRQGVEKLYYGVLITQKQQEEARLKVELARAKLNDAQHALQAGETLSANTSGLEAAIADEEQNRLKLDIQEQDYRSELANLTGAETDSIHLAAIPAESDSEGSWSAYSLDLDSNMDIQIAVLTRSKAMTGLKAVRQSNLPDIGVIAGYYYQQGNPILPTSSPFVGVSFKWNLQDLFSNKAIGQQRQAQLREAEDNLAYTQQQVGSDMDKARRKIRQATAVIAAAAKALQYRREDLKVMEDKQASGMDVHTALLESRTRLAHSEADYYAACLSYTLAVSDLQYLGGHVPGQLHP